MKLDKWQIICFGISEYQGAQNDWVLINLLSIYFSQVVEWSIPVYFSALPTTGGQVAEITYDVTFKLFYSQQSVGPVQLEKVLEKYQWITEEEIRLSLQPDLDPSSHYYMILFFLHF